jgi:hypothetical protein
MLYSVIDLITLGNCLTRHRLHRLFSKYLIFTKTHFLICRWGWWLPHWASWKGQNSANQRGKSLVWNNIYVISWRRSDIQTREVWKSLLVPTLRPGKSRKSLLVPTLRTGTRWEARGPCLWWVCSFLRRGKRTKIKQKRYKKTSAEYINSQLPGKLAYIWRHPVKKRSTSKFTKLLLGHHAMP